MPQLNPEFFISQLFWLLISFTFLFIFLWRISLPRIGSVLEKRADKINEDLKIAKQYQAEAEKIQTNIDNQLREAKIETLDLIKKANVNLKDYAKKELDKLDANLILKIDDTLFLIDKNKKNSLDEINNQIFNITKLTLSKISNLTITDDEIKNSIKILQQKAIN